MVAFETTIILSHEIASKYCTGATPFILRDFAYSSNNGHLS